MKKTNYRKKLDARGAKRRKQYGTAMDYHGMMGDLSHHYGKAPRRRRRAGGGGASSSGQSISPGALLGIGAGIAGLGALYMHWQDRPEENTVSSSRAYGGRPRPRRKKRIFY